MNESTEHLADAPGGDLEALLRLGYAERAEAATVSTPETGAAWVAIDARRDERHGLDPRRLLLAAAAIILVVGLTGGLLLMREQGDGVGTVTPMATSTTVRPPGTTAPPPGVPGVEGGKVRLGAGGVGEVAFGVPFDDAVAALTEVLGEPDTTNEADAQKLQGRRVGWGAFNIAADLTERFSGWNLDRFASARENPSVTTGPELVVPDLVIPPDGFSLGMRREDFRIRSSAQQPFPGYLPAVLCGQLERAKICAAFVPPASFEGSGTDDDPVISFGVSVSSVTTPSTDPTGTAPLPDPHPDGDPIFVSGDGIGDAQIGDPADQAISWLIEHLGPAGEDEGWNQGNTFYREPTRYLRWGGLSVTFIDRDGDRTMAGWALTDSQPAPSRIRLPEGVSLDGTVGELDDRMGPLYQASLEGSTGLCFEAGGVICAAVDPPWQDFRVSRVDTARVRALIGGIDGAVRLSGLPRYGAPIPQPDPPARGQTWAGLVPEATVENDATSFTALVTPRGCQNPGETAGLTEPVVLENEFAIVVVVYATGVTGEWSTLCERPAVPIEISFSATIGDRALYSVIDGKPYPVERTVPPASDTEG